MSANSADEPPAQTNVISGSTRRRAFWIGLGIVLFFAAGFLEFALVDYWALPAEQRTNNGKQATFFAVHINPYFVFSEDFHLYVVRSQRIARRGWTDSPLCHRDNEGHNYAAPLQVALMSVAAATGGHPVPYACFMVGVLVVAWSTLYCAAVRWIRSDISPLSILVAVLVTVLFESIYYLFHWSTEYQHWPVHRGLRMATLGWTSPLALSALIAAVSLLFDPQRRWERLVFLAMMSAALAAADSWAFLITAACMSVGAGLSGLVILRTRPRRWQELRPQIITVVALLGAIGLGLAIHRATGGAISGDAFTRAGFGPAWINSPASLGRSQDYWRAARNDLLLLGALTVAAGIALQIKVSRPRSLQLSFDWQQPTGMRLYLLMLVAVPILAWILIVGALNQIGMENYHASQFNWRLEFMLLFAFVLTAAEIVRWGLRHFARGEGQWWRYQIAAAVLLLTSLFGLHTAKIHKFVTRVAAREFFLTRDEEELQTWLKAYDAAHPHYTLATASHELNYLAASWTNADLLLPEGFPYHGVWTQQEIDDRMTRILQIYESTPQRWRNFNLNCHSMDQWSWAYSRLLSARQGNTYYLLHRELLRQGPHTRPVGSDAPRHTTEYWCDVRLGELERTRFHPYRQHKTGNELIQRIAQRLPSAKPLTEDQWPDVVIVDEASRYLGSPNLSNYTCQFQYGDLEAWVKNAPDAPASATP